MAETNTPRPIHLSPSEIDLLERVVHYEARGEGVEGRNAVRAVILNRLASGRFGRNLLSVVNGRNQFEPVMRYGRGDARRLRVDRATLNTGRQEFVDFLRGGVDPTGGATFFQNVGTAQNAYNSGQTGLKIGNHTFYTNYNGNAVEVPQYEVSLRGFREGLSRVALSPLAPETSARPPSRPEPELTPYSGATKGKSAAPAEPADKGPSWFDRINPFSAYNNPEEKVPNRPKGIATQDELQPYSAQKYAEGGLVKRDYSQILAENADKPFVDRILNPGNYPLPERQRDEEGQTYYETHRMSYSEGDDGKFYVYPTVYQAEDGTYHKSTNPDEAYDRAMKSGDYIQFDDERAAEDFSVNYKPDSFKQFYEDNMKTKGFAKGGIMTPDMMDSCMGHDPVSGNPIPLGSSAENVRDDIPAMLSQGEYVVPADVVQWHGLKRFMQLRAEAKMGLMAMHMEGQLHTTLTADEEDTEEEDPGSEEDLAEDAAEGEVDDPEAMTEDDGTIETEEGNTIEVVSPDIETTMMPEAEDLYGDNEVIMIFKADPSAFRLA